MPRAAPISSLLRPSTTCATTSSSRFESRARSPGRGRTHRVVEADGPIDAGRLVGRFPDPDGRPLALVEGAEGPGRPATLEEVVLGQLAAARVGAVPTAMPTTAGEAAA